MEKLAERYFDDSVSIRERAIFELGIKLSTIFHMMLGAPVKNDPDVLREIAEGLKASVSCQPFVERVEVNLKIPKEGMSHEYSKKHQFDYTTIDGEMLNAEIELHYKEWKVIGKVEWSSDLYYPIMFVESIEKL